MRRPNRREFLKTATGVAVTATGWVPCSRASADEAESITFGVVTDVHYADVPRGGSRYYRDSQEKLRQAVETFHRRKVAFVAELGDFVDAGPEKADDLRFLHAIREVFGELQCDRHYVLGNHCLTRLTKTEFLANCGAQIKQSHYSFDQGPLHFVVLDANFKRDGSPYAEGNFGWTDTWIHEPQQRWLAEDLQRVGDKQTVVLIHQNLDKEKDAHGVKNGPAVREVLEKAGNIAAVFQGHMHSGGYQQIAEIPYHTLPAMVEGPGLENNTYAIVTAHKSGRTEIERFGSAAQ
ncbi:MAG TPA: metallophosphoesterase [Thermoguttaceae bacterium]|nr:metallophosphoesterase [Thermoguttaceae bacterium]